MMTETRKTYDDMTETERQAVADALWTRERPRCQSALIDDLLKLDGEIDGFGVDDIDGLYPDPSDWTPGECADWLDENAGGPMDYPSECAGPLNPWKMGRADIVAELEGEYGCACYDDEDTSELAEALAENRSGEDSWRDAVRDNAEPAEVYEWWEVGGWLCDRLSAAGEVVIDNSYGHWWGRCCTGQSVTLDPVIQRLGAEFCAWALDK